jgi:HSP20 family protein
MRLIPRGVFKKDRIFDDFWAPLAWHEDLMEGFFTPKVDVKECGDHYEINAELPGVEKGDIKITLDDGVLTLEAEVKQEDKEEKNGRVIRQERRYGKLMRRFELEGDVVEKDIEAEFKDGVLKLRAPLHQAGPKAAKRLITIN